MCFDAFSVPAALEQTRAFGLEPSDSSISFLESINSLFSVLQKLNLTFNVHGGIVFSNDLHDDPNEPIVMTFNTDGYLYYHSVIPGYEWTNMGPVLMATNGDFCPEP